MRATLRILLVLTTLGLAGLAGCSNHKPVFDELYDQTIETGKQFEMTIRAYDNDNDPLSFGIEGKPAAADFTDNGDGTALFQWVPLAADAGPDGRGQEYSIVFKVTDGIATTSEVVEITVVLGGAGTGSPIFVTPSDHTLDLDRTDEVQFNIEVRDADSASIDLRIEDNPPGGTFETAPGSKLASYRWRPSPDQIAEKPVWGIQVSADDHANPKVYQDVTILLKGGAGKCEGTPPDILHEELPDQREAGDYQVEAAASDADSAIATVALYFLVDMGEGGEYSKQTMAHVDGDTWTGTIPNPGLQGEQTAKVSYYLCAQDDDDPGGSNCDLRTCLPKDGRFSFTAYAAGNQQCEDDGFEANDSGATATIVEPGTYQDRKICPDDEDWYLIQVPTNHWMGAGIGFTQANGALEIDLFADDGSTLLAQGEPDENQELVYSEVTQQAETFLLRVRGAAGVENSYDLVLVIEEYVPCSPDAYEPNDTPDDARTVAEGEFAGLTCCGEPDWYKLDLNQGDGLDALIEFDTADGDLDLWIFESSAFGDEVLSCDNAVACSTTETDDESVSIPSLPLTTTYYIAVGPYEGAKNDYDMTVLVTPGQQGCVDDGNEEDDTPAEASDLWDFGPLNGQICADDEDWFQTLGYAGETLVFDLTFSHADGDLDLKLYSDGVSMDSLAEHQLASSASATDDERIEYPIPAEGFFYVRVYGYDGAQNAYSLEMTIQ